MVSPLVRDLEKILAGDVNEQAAVLDAASTDASIFRVRPAVVVAPKDARDIEKLVTYARSCRPAISLTPRAAGTDMSGGPLSESVVVDMKKYFTSTVRVGANDATVEPGVMFTDFDRKTRQKNLILPCYPASRELCTLGGIFANNAGGEKSLTYGQAQNWITSLNIVLADGREHTIKPLTADELKQKITGRDYTADLYKKIYTICDENYALLQKARPRVSKDSTGYPLWRVWDKKTFDLTQLFVGSQGTLGIITELTVKLTRPKPKKRLLVIFLTDIAKLPTVVERVLAHRPESFECYDNKTLGLALRFLPEIAARVGRSWWTVATTFWPELLFVARHGLPKLFLLAEFTGESQMAVDRQARRAQKSLADVPVAAHLAATGVEQKKYWVVRRESFNLLRHHLRHVHTAPFIDDVCVRPEQLAEFLPRLQNIMADYNLQFTIAGHIGDANFHIFPLMDFRQPATRAIVPELSRRVFDLVFEFGGTMSGEHNDGLVRTPYLEKMYGPDVVGLFREIKNVCDPNNIFNPGKKVNLDPNFARLHMVTS